MKKDFQKWHDKKSQVDNIIKRLRFIDARRLSYHIGEISEVDFRALKEKLKALLP